MRSVSASVSVRCVAALVGVMAMTVAGPGANAESVPAASSHSDTGLAADGAVELVTVRTDGRPARRASDTPDVSDDGEWVTFSSRERRLTADETIRGQQVYRLARSTGEVVLVSRAEDGGAGDGRSVDSRVSADGRFIAFWSHAPNLVPGDRHDGLWEVFLRDMDAGTTTLVAVGRHGGAVNAGSELGGISADGRFVVYSSQASNLAPRDRNQQSDVFLLDRSDGSTTLLSRGGRGRSAQGSSTDPAISADGRLVSYTSDAPGLVEGDATGVRQALLLDRETGVTTLVSHTPDGGYPDGPSGGTDLSPDGTHVAFSSYAGDIASGGSQYYYDIFLEDVATGAITLVSRGGHGEPPDGASRSASVADLGAAVTFTSDADNLVPGGTEGYSEVFVADMVSGDVIAVGRRDEKMRFHSFSSVITADGRSVVLASYGDLVERDANGVTDVYRWTADGAV